MVLIADEIKYEWRIGNAVHGYRVPMDYEGWLTPIETLTFSGYLDELWSLNGTMERNEKLARLHEKRWLVSKDSTDIENAKALRATAVDIIRRKCEICALLNEIGRQATLRKIDAEIATII